MPSTLAQFRRQLTSAVRALSLRIEKTSSERCVAARPIPLSKSATSAQRMVDLNADCSLLATGFEDLDGLMQQYIREVPLARNSGTADAERFLEWLATHQDLDDVQRDAIVCLQSQYTVAFVAMKKRLSHARFQELLSNNPRLAKELSRNRSIQVHLNPAHIWATLETRTFLDDDTEVPARVMFYPVKNTVRGAVIADELQLLLHKLERGPRTLADLRWVMPRHGDWDLLDALRELAQLGIVALA